MHDLNQWVCVTSIGFHAVPPTFERLKDSSNLLLHISCSFSILRTDLWKVKKKKDNNYNDDDNDDKNVELFMAQIKHFNYILLTSHCRYD